jgi:hypothetical protein
MTTNTITHDSITCTEGRNGGRCAMCQFAMEWERSGYAATPDPLARETASTIEQSAATIRARRAALLERADAHSPTEGAIALAEAWLSDEAWYCHLPNNVMRDAAVLELAGEIEGVIGEYLARRQEQA